MLRNTNADTPNPYVSPRSLGDGTAAVGAPSLPWFCRIAFVWGCVVCLMAIAPELLGLAGWIAAGSNSPVGTMWADLPMGTSIARWVFCVVGLAVNCSLLLGRRRGLWPAYLYLVLGAGLFMMVVFSIRAGTMFVGGTDTHAGPKSATIALFAFLGAGSLGYYVLALHVYRTWLKNAVDARVS